MSSIVEFFIAPGDDAAAAVADRGPDRVNEDAAYGNFDPVGTMGQWESSFGIAGDDGPCIITGDGPRLVLAVPGSLQAALASADEESYWLRPPDAGPGCRPVTARRSALNSLATC